MVVRKRVRQEAKVRREKARKCSVQVSDAGNSESSATNSMSGPKTNT